MPYLAIAASVSPPPAMLNALDCGDRARDRLGAVGERVELEHADRAVPDDGAGGLQLRRPACAAVCGPMSRIRSSAATSVAAFTVAGRVGRELLGARPRRSGSALRRRAPSSRRSPPCASSTRSGSASDLADRQAGGQHEGVGDAAADDQLVDLRRPALCRMVSLVDDLASRRRSPPAAASGWPAPWRSRRSRPPAAGRRRRPCANCAMP